MGFFKEFREDFNDALDEMIPGESSSDEVMVNTLDGDIDVESELNKLDGLLEKVSKRVDEPAAPVEPVAEPQINAEVEEVNEEVIEEVPVDNGEYMEESEQMDTITNEMTAEPKSSVSDETAIITSGMKITGNLESVGSIEVQGQVNGNVACNGKLVVTGRIIGNSSSAEFFADAAKIEGEVTTTGTAKIGVGSVIIGNITATSAVIAGAVKGDIDVDGPVVVDTSAVVMGNIKSRSVQINNGAVIEGFCSQSYSEVDMNSVFN